MTRRPTQKDRLKNDPLAWVGGNDAASTAHAPAADQAAATSGAGDAGKSVAAKPAAAKPAAAKPAAPKPAAKSVPLWDALMGTQGFDQLQTPIVISDADMVVRYVNRAAYDMFRPYEADIQRDLPDFSLSTMVGQSVDAFHKHPPHQRRIVGAMTGAMDGRLSVGGRHYHFFATPMWDENRALGGAIIEWKDETDAVLALREADLFVTDTRAMAKAHAAGEIDHDLDTTRYSPGYNAVAVEVNDMLRGHREATDALIACVTGITSGKLDTPLRVFPGKRAMLNVAAERIRATAAKAQVDIERLTKDLVALGRAHKAGDIDARIDASGYALPEYAAAAQEVNDSISSYVAIVEKLMEWLRGISSNDLVVTMPQYPGKLAKINTMAERAKASFANAVAMIGRIADDLEQGQLDRKVDIDSLNGNFRPIVEALVRIQGTIRSVTGEIGDLSQAIVDGKLDSRVDLGNHKGAFGSIMASFDRAFGSLNGAFGRIGQQVEQVAITVEQMTQAASSL
ncbi:MAG: methyl-accepting chemotaxis protein, partial [Rhodobacteraceae bacterium]|nr:methyl-accepting chemotaxis protein [Paracoccaceae bacterium]